MLAAIVDEVFEGDGLVMSTAMEVFFGVSHRTN
jgi:hypothetical protein